MNTPPLKNGVVLLTGASSGIGREMARELATTCRTLILVARRADRLEELKGDLRCLNPGLTILIRPCDLTDRVAAAALVDGIEREVGGVDILINNAGIGDIGFFAAADWPKLDRMLELNVFAPAYLTHRLLPAMIRRGRGGILNVSSGFGYTFLPGFATYVGTKHFVTGWTDTLRAELAGTGVVVSQLVPGPVATEFARVALESPGELAPAFVTISARHCARSAIRGFARGRAVIVPGFMASLLIGLGRLTPRWVLRQLGARLNQPLRDRLEKNP